MQIERWMPVDGYEGLYEVSDRGRVRSFHASHHRAGPEPHVLSGGDCHGYRIVVLCKGKRKTTRMIHLIVADAFLGAKPHPDSTVNHKNRDKSDNCVENLEWMSHLDNVRHSAKVIPRNRGEANHSKLKENDVREIRRRWLLRETLTSLSNEFGVSLQTCSAIVKRKKWAYLD